MRDKGIFLRMLFAVGTGYIITGAVFIIYALLLTYSDMTDKNLSVTVMGAVIVSTAAAGMLTAFAAEKKGLMWGAAAGLIYALIMIMVGMCMAENIGIGAKTAMTAVLSAAGGGMGGIVGI
ncbi:MAG: TIGR04086 family membrane protein, partial [Firmicutes bacterium]|nr:TIGR04086 family membrane protein [Bacillota bacterium]